MTDREFDQYVLSLTVRDRDTRQAGFDLLCSNSGELDNRAARIQHGSGKAPCDLVSGSIETCKQGHQEQRPRLRPPHAFPHSSSRIKSDFAKQFLVGAFENTPRESLTG